MLDRERASVVSRGDFGFGFGLVGHMLSTIVQTTDLSRY